MLAPILVVGREADLWNVLLLLMAGENCVKKGCSNEESKAQS
jgi:hypothetical protein